MRDRIPASILYIGLLHNLRQFKAALALSGAVGLNTFQIRSLSVMQNTRGWSVKVPLKYIPFLRELLPGSSGEKLSVQLNVIPHAVQIAEDGGWARTILEFRFQVEGVLGTVDASAFQRYEARVAQGIGHVFWIMGQPQFP